MVKLKVAFNNLDVAIYNFFRLNLEVCCILLRLSCPREQAHTSPKITPFAVFSRTLHIKTPRFFLSHSAEYRALYLSDRPVSCKK